MSTKPSFHAVPKLQRCNSGAAAFLSTVDFGLWATLVRGEFVFRVLGFAFGFSWLEPARHYMKTRHPHGSAGQAQWRLWHQFEIPTLFVRELPCPVQSWVTGFQVNLL